MVKDSLFSRMECSTKPIINATMSSTAQQKYHMAEFQAPPLLLIQYYKSEPIFNRQTL